MGKRNGRHPFSNSIVVGDAMYCYAGNASKPFNQCAGKAVFVITKSIISDFQQISTFATAPRNTAIAAWASFQI